MLFSKTVTKTEDVQIEIKTPSYYKVGTMYPYYFMICEDGSLINVMGSLISRYEPEKAKYEISREIDNGVEVTEDEFMVAYDKTLKLFETSIFPETLKIENE